MEEVLVWVIEDKERDIRVISGAFRDAWLIHHDTRPLGVFNHSGRLRSKKNVDKRLLATIRGWEQDGRGQVTMEPVVLRVPPPTNADLSMDRFTNWVEAEVVPVVEARMAVLS